MNRDRPEQRRRPRRVAVAASDQPANNEPAILLSDHAIAANPGALTAKAFVPEGLPANSPLVVVLHGCGQTAETYDKGVGWTLLAARHGFAVLYPEQLCSNNLNGCFNWFAPGDMTRDAGEPASIRHMIDGMIGRNAIDPDRVFITGLSAGAAMAGVMLATYPEAFAGGGLIAGIPYGVARSVPAAFRHMRGGGAETETELGDLVRSASDHMAPWPAISIWHGTADATVNVSNSGATASQWRDVHQLRDADAIEKHSDRCLHRVWRDASGRACVEEFLIVGMGHGTPLDVDGPASTETASAQFIDVGVSSTRHLAAAWGLLELAPEKGRAEDEPRRPARKTSRTQVSEADRSRVRKLIRDALTAAGLMG